MRRRSATGSTLRTSSPSTVMLPLIGVDQPVRQPQQRGLAGAGAADDGEKLALGDVERDVVARPCTRPPSKLLATCAKAIGGGVGMSGPASYSLMPPSPGEGRRPLARRRIALNLSSARR